MLCFMLSQGKPQQTKLKYKNKIRIIYFLIKQKYQQQKKEKKMFESQKRS